MHKLRVNQPKSTSFIFGLDRQDLNKLLSGSTIQIDVPITTDLQIKVEISFCESETPVSFDEETKVYSIPLSEKGLRFITSGYTTMTYHIFESGLALFAVLFAETDEALRARLYQAK